MKGFKNNSYPGGGYNGPHGQESELYKGNMQNPKDAGYYEQDSANQYRDMYRENTPYAEQSGYNPENSSYAEQPGYNPDNFSYAEQSGYNQANQMRTDYNSSPYYQNSYPQSTYQDHYGRNEKRQNAGSGFAIAGLVLGIMSIILFWTMPIAMIMAVIGIILSVIALSKNQSRGLSIAGIITSIVGGILSILTVVIILITLAELDIYDPDDIDDNIFSPYPYAENEQENPFKDFEDFFDEFRP